VLVIYIYIYIYIALQGGRIFQQGGREVRVPEHGLLRYKSKIYFPKETGRKIKELVCSRLDIPTRERKGSKREGRCKR
jgi:hypothetical protein